MTLKDFPDPHVCREKIWLPFIEQELGADDRAVLVGHSSGAVAAMRMAERRKLRGIVVIAGYDSDLGDANEKASGYFNRPFDWATIKSNCDFIISIGGTRDELVPIETQRRVADAMNATFIELKSRDHFFTPPFDDLIDCLTAACPPTSD